MIRFWIGVSAFAIGLGFLDAMGEEKQKPNLTFGKVQDLEIELVPVPDSVGSGGKPVPTGAEAKSSQDGRWLRIDVPFSTEKKNYSRTQVSLFSGGL